MAARVEAAPCWGARAGLEQLLRASSDASHLNALEEAFSLEVGRETPCFEGQEVELALKVGTLPLVAWVGLEVGPCHLVSWVGLKEDPHHLVPIVVVFVLQKYMYKLLQITLQYYCLILFLSLKYCLLLYLL